MFVILWQFEVNRACVDDFECMYGPAGDWARLFAYADDYLGTDLMKDCVREGRYLTIDRWKSSEAFGAFIARWSELYDSLQRQAEGLVAAKREIGRFESIRAP
jgi:hypothetical protein